MHMWAWQLSRNWRAGAWGVQRGASLLYRIACWLSLSRCFCHVLGTALAASASAPPALRRAAACIMANPQAAAPAPPAVAAAQKGLSLSSAVPAAVEGAWRGSLAQCCCFSGSLILALNAAASSRVEDHHKGWLCCRMGMRSFCDLCEGGAPKAL
ncbi:unnamed protein product [Closterium sp. NIES-64]|nr:unnamed protein product [Closterium sp. NIES-64]